MRLSFFCSTSLLVAVCASPGFGQEVILHHHHVLMPSALAERNISAPPSSAITPTLIREAYGFNLVANKGQGQIIGIVDAYDDPNAEADLGVFSTTYGLAPCTTANGCFKKIYASGRKPVSNVGWGEEISLDVQWAHAIAPQAKIYLIEAASATSSALYRAVDVAVQNGATVISMSFGAGETVTEASDDLHFNVPGVTFVASAGDSDHGVDYPAASPYVVGVGGTSLTQNNGVYVSEQVWNSTSTEGTGGGISLYETEPSYQTSFQNMGMRGVPDLAYDADPNTGVAIYDSFGGYKWVQIGGTSMGAPQIAGAVAIIKSSRAAANKGALQFPAAVYHFGADYHDITVGTNGGCGAVCDAAPGYDFTTGIGTPVANALIPALVALP